MFAIGDDTPSKVTKQTTPDLLDTDDLVRQLADADALFGTEEAPSLLELQQLADAPPMADDFAAFASTPPAEEFASFESAPAAAPAAPPPAPPLDPPAPPPAPATMTPSKDPFGAFAATAAPPPPPRPPSPGRRDTTDILADLEEVLGDAPAAAAPAPADAAFDVDDFESFLDGLDGGK